MFTHLIQTLRNSLRTQPGLEAVLARMDDHLLEDIGLTRHEARQLVARAPAVRPATTYKIARSVSA